MANICRTEVYVHANMSTIDWFEKLVRDFDVDDYIGQFGDLDAESMIDRIGSKWLMKYDWYREDSYCYFVSFESAWYPPDVLLKNIWKQVSEYDPSAYLDGRYWDEIFSPVGIFEIHSNGEMLTAEANLDIDWDNDNYWEEQVEAAFRKLEI